MCQVLWRRRSWQDMMRTFCVVVVLVIGLTGATNEKREIRSEDEFRRLVSSSDRAFLVEFFSGMCGFHFPCLFPPATHSRGEVVGDAGTARSSSRRGWSWRVRRRDWNRRE